MMQISTKLLDTNNTKYHYGVGVLDETIKEYMKRDYKLVYSEVGSTDLVYAIGKVESIEKNDIGEIWANIELLDTPKGKEYQEIIKQTSINFGISGYGNINEDGIVENFDIKSISSII